MRKYIFAPIVLVVLFMGLDRMAHKKSTRFSVSKITTSSKAPEWDIPALSLDQKKELNDIFNQKFTYFSKGAQTYVFVSQDQKYVIKFLKLNKFNPQTWLSYIPLSFNPHYQELLKLREKRRKTFDAAKIAYTQFKQETQIAYVHINRTNDLKKQLTIIDRKGKSHLVSLDEVSFILQKKADLIYPRITELMSQNNLEGAKKVVASVFSLIDTLGRKGVVENDPVIRKNFGLINDEAVQLDIGCMRVDPLQPLKYKSEIAHMALKFDNWVKINHPELHPYFKAYLNAVCEP